MLRVAGRIVDWSGAHIGIAADEKTVAGEVRDQHKVEYFKPGQEQ